MTMMSLFGKISPMDGGWITMPVNISCLAWSTKTTRISQQSLRTSHLANRAERLGKGIEGVEGREGCSKGWSSSVEVRRRRPPVKEGASGGVAIAGCKELCGCNKDACGYRQGADWNDAADGEPLRLEDVTGQVWRYDWFAHESDAWNGAFHQHFRGGGVSKWEITYLRSVVVIRWVTFLDSLNLSTYLSW